MAKPEAQTRSELIEKQLAHAGWSKSRRSIIEELLLTSVPKSDLTENNTECRTVSHGILKPIFRPAYSSGKQN